jgi:gas vesicle protein
MKMSKKSGIGKLVAGIGIGAGLGMLFAPKKGSETRDDLKKKICQLSDKVKEIDVDEVKKEFNTKVDDIKNELEDLDKEKVLKIAKEKGEQLKKKADELVQLAKDKGTPVLEGMAEDVRQKAISVTKDVLDKLESEK